MSNGSRMVASGLEYSIEAALQSTANQPKRVIAHPLFEPREAWLLRAHSSQNANTRAMTVGLPVANADESFNNIALGQRIRAA